MLGVFFPIQRTNDGYLSDGSDDYSLIQAKTSAPSVSKLLQKLDRLLKEARPAADTNSRNNIFTFSS